MIIKTIKKIFMKINVLALESYIKNTPKVAELKLNFSDDRRRFVRFEASDSTADKALQIK